MSVLLCLKIDKNAVLSAICTKCEEMLTWYWLKFNRNLIKSFKNILLEVYTSLKSNLCGYLPHLIYSKNELGAKVYAEVSTTIMGVLWTPCCQGRILFHGISKVNQISWYVTNGPIMYIYDITRSEYYVNNNPLGKTC